MSVEAGELHLYPGAAVGLDPDQHLLRLTVLAKMVRDQLVQPSHPVNALRQPPPDKESALLVLDLHVMMGLGPVITNEQQHVTSVILTFVPDQALEEARAT